MKKVFLNIFLMFSCAFCFGQYCTYSGGSCANGLANPTNYATKIVSDICRTLNIPYINTYQGNLQNACAFELNGSPTIAYNANFLNYLSNHNTWAPVSVLAHEVGHHFYKDSSWYGAFEHSWTKELRADYISGYVLFKMGCSLENAKSTFYIMFDWMGSRTHPDTPRRIAALTLGYLKAYNGG